MFGLKSSGEKVVPSTTHSLPSGTLGLERVPLFDILAEMEVKVLLDNDCAVKGEVVVAALDAIKLISENRNSIVGRIGNQKGEVDEMMRIGQLGKKLKVGGQVWGGILQRGKDKNSLAIFNGFGCRVNGVEVDMLYRRGIDLDGPVVVEDDWRLEMAIPGRLLVGRHIHRRLCRTPAIEARKGRYELVPNVSIVGSRDADRERSQSG